MQWCVIDIAGLSNETVDRLMDYVEKYLMVRLYRLTFCSYLTDDEERDLVMQNRIRSLHWITSHLLDTALDESFDGVRDLLDSAITGQLTLNTLTISLLDFINSWILRQMPLW